MADQDDNGQPMFTMAMLAAYVGIFAAQWKGADGLWYLRAFSWRLAGGETWRLITSTMMHGSVLHIVFNAIWFFRFSRAIENWMGPWVALLMYAFFAAGSMAAQSLVSGPRSTAIGASGVVYGMFGFLWVLRRRRDDAADAVPVSVSQTMLGWLVICFFLNRSGGNIANTAHIAGLGLGWGLGQAFVATKRTRLPIAAATLFVGLLLTAMTYGPVWRRTLAYVPVLHTKFVPYALHPSVQHSMEHPDPETELAQRPGLVR